MAVEKAPPDQGSYELPKVERIIQDALSLSRDDREALLVAVEDSLVGTKCGPAFLSELDRRAAAIADGEPTYALEDVVAALRVPR